ncbi:MAG: methyltransferase type 11 [Thermoproteus sp. JCHS_4]|jgi:Methylase involved in ubiquinone/menaquinone biosynthesis|nr:MAG: methyltransferase type 11 [Thermoproteus sp. JCHS_4]
MRAAGWGEDPLSDLDSYDIGGSVLDVGTGWGGLLRYLLSRGAAEVWSVDVDPRALSRAEREFEAAVRAGVLRLLRARAEELPFEDGRFDYVISLAAVHHFSDVGAALAEMARVSRGYVLVYDWAPESAGLANPHSARELAEAMEAAVEAGRRLGYRAERRGLWYKLELAKAK